MSETPRIIWALWLQGWDRTPEIVRACAESWSRLHPDWDVRALDRSAVEERVPWLREKSSLSPQAWSDVARTALLAEHGGVWVDATVFAHRRLDDWLPQGFFAFRSPAPGRPLSSWLLATPPEGRIITAWAQAAQEYWAARSETKDYFWLHHLFGDLVSSDAAFADDWAAAPRTSADGPHYFAPYGRRYTGPMSRRTEARLASRHDAVYKLTHRIDPDQTAHRSAARYFAAGAAAELRPSQPVLALDRPLEVASRRYVYGKVAVRRSARRVVRRLTGPTSNQGRGAST